LNGYTLRISKDSKILFNHFILPHRRWYAKKGVIAVSQQSMFWKREIFQKIGYLDITFYAKMDKEFLIRIFKSNCKIEFMKEILGAIRIHENTKTARNGQIWVEDEEKIKKIHDENYGENTNSIYWKIYGIHKIVYGLYLKQYIFRKRWFGKTVQSLFHENEILKK